MFSVIIVSAGTSQRYRKSAGDKNKTLELIGGLPVFIHSLLAFKDSPYREIILMVSPDDYREGVYSRCLEEYRGSIPDYSSLTSRLQIIPGGVERYLSVGNGLSRCSADSKWVLIHDAARPLLHEADLSRIKDAIESHQDREVGILPVTQPTDTIKQVDEEGWVVGNLLRTSLRGASTPQCFPLTLFQEVYRKQGEQNQALQNSGAIPTDDSEIFFSAGYPILTVPLSHPNPKLTTVDDYEYLSRLWERRSQERS